MDQETFIGAPKTPRPLVRPRSNRMGRVRFSGTALHKSISLLAFIPVVAVAADLPSFDINALCKRQPTDLLYISCMQVEAEAVKTLTAETESIPNGMMDYCTKVAKHYPEGSYDMLRQCIDRRKTGQPPGVPRQ